MFGHKRGSAKCAMKQPEDAICLYCAEKHVSKHCPVKKSPEKHKCSNCVKYYKSDSVNVKHSSNCAECPILQSELKGLLNRTMGCTTDEKIAKNEIST